MLIQWFLLPLNPSVFGSGAGRIEDMKLSVIVPVYNEEKTVGKMLSKLVKVADVYEVIVVDDGEVEVGEVVKE